MNAFFQWQVGQISVIYFKRKDWSGWQFVPKAFGSSWQSVQIDGPYY